MLRQDNNLCYTKCVKRLLLAVVAQALLDLGDEETDEEFENDPRIYLARYPELLKKWQRMSPAEREHWKQELEKALGRF